MPAATVIGSVAATKSPAMTSVPLRSRVAAQVALGVKVPAATSSAVTVCVAEVQDLVVWAARLCQRQLGAPVVRTPLRFEAVGKTVRVLSVLFV